MLASHVKPYVKRGKPDAADTEAICEAVTRPTMRFVPIKTAEQQAVLMLHRTRDLRVRQRTMLVNALRGHVAETGIIAPQGISRVGDPVAALLGEDEAQLPKLARYALRGLAAELEALGERVKEVEGAILAWHKDNEASRRLATVPGIGPITASAIVAAVTDPMQFHPARRFAAWIGLVPKQYSSGGKERQGGISKQGPTQRARCEVQSTHGRSGQTIRKASWGGSAPMPGRSNGRRVAMSRRKVPYGLTCPQISGVSPRRSTAAMRPTQIGSPSTRWIMSASTCTRQFCSRWRLSTVASWSSRRLVAISPPRP